MLLSSKSLPKDFFPSSPQGPEIRVLQPASTLQSPKHSHKGAFGRVKFQKPWIRFIVSASLSCFAIFACLLLYSQLPSEVLKSLAVGLVKSPSQTCEDGGNGVVQCDALNETLNATTVFGLNNGSNSFSLTDETLVPLPPGLSQDTDTCWSRQERHLYLKNVRHRPSPSFVSAVRVYESYHARCTAGVTDWSARFRDSAGNEGGDSDCKYLVYLRGDGGMGNRLLSLVSAFVYALLTNRVLLVDTTYIGLDALFCNPFPSSPFFVRFNALQAAPRLGEYLKGTADPAGRQDTALIFLEWDSTTSDSPFYCATAQEQIAEVTWIGFNSDTYPLPHMQLVPRFRERLVELFPDHVILFHVLHYLLHPANNLWERIRNIHQSYLDHSDKLVGLQIRTFAGYDKEVDPRILQCLNEHGSVPPLIPVERHEALHRAGYYARVRKFLNRSPRSYITVLVTSLDAAYYESLKRTYTERVTADGTIVRVHMESKDGQQLLSLDQDQKATIEMWLLSFSDELFISHTSTFGYIAAGLGGHGAISMNIVDRERDLRWSWRDGGDVCVKVSVEPCQQVTGPQVTCEGDGYQTGSFEDESGKTVNRQFPLYIRKCTDFRSHGLSGLQLQPQGERL